MNRKDITDAVFDAIDNQYQDGCEVELTDTLIDLRLDSLDMVEICTKVEETLECGNLDDVFNIADYTITVEELIDAICKHLGI